MHVLEAINESFLDTVVAVIRRLSRGSSVLLQLGWH